MKEKEPRKKGEGAPRKEPPSKELSTDYSKDWRDADPYKNAIRPPVQSGNDR